MLTTLKCQSEKNFVRSSRFDDKNNICKKWKQRYGRAKKRLSSLKTLVRNVKEVHILITNKLKKDGRL